MIFGVGTDIVAVKRMTTNLEQYGEKFARKILTDDEFLDFQKAPSQAHFLAKRFAAKEAAAKAMGTGFSQGLSLKHIGVTHNENGKPELAYFGRARELIAELGVSKSHISIADETEHAVAFVTLSND
jgi:holo-[acyl-carrier protein] synthase